MFLEACPLKKLKAVSIHLDSALDRVSAENIIAKEDLPRVDRSAVDGYAVKAEDTVGASQFKPKTLTIADGEEISAKQGKQVWTGNSLPKGANAVIMLENTKRRGAEVEVWTPLTPNENVSKKGEDIKRGEIAVKAGIRLKPQHLGLIAALGMTEIRVFEKPKIAILATGNELQEIGNRLQEGQVFDVNRHVVSALCQELGAEPLDLGISGDDAEEITKKLRAGLSADVIITTGGTSVGAPDVVPEAVAMMGKPGIVVHGIAMRPAMPTALAIVDEKPIVILSGNPVAAMIGFEVFARPLICRMLGLEHKETRPSVEAELTKKVSTALGRRNFVRVRVFQEKSEFFAEPVSARGSGLISTMTRSNGYVIVPENREGLAQGETVLVHLFDSIEAVG
jgi:molybdopterin molybdotransferase